MINFFKKFIIILYSIFLIKNKLIKHIVNKINLNKIKI